MVVLRVSPPVPCHVTFRFWRYFCLAFIKRSSIDTSYASQLKFGFVEVIPSSRKCDFPPMVIVYSKLRNWLIGIPGVLCLSLSMDCILVHSITGSVLPLKCRQQPEKFDMITDILGGFFMYLINLYYRGCLRCDLELSETIFKIFASLLSGFSKVFYIQREV